MRSFHPELYRTLRDRHLLSPQLNRELEKGFLQCPESAYKWAEYVREAPWPTGEKVIAEDAHYSFNYAKNTLRRNRFPKGEPTVIADPDTAVDYAMHIIDGAWPEAEDSISKNAGASYRYSRYVLQGKFPKGEAAMAQDPGVALEYALCWEQPFPEAEAGIAQDAEKSYLYASHVIKGRWPQGEPVMQNHAEYAYYYATEVLKGRFKAAEPALANSYRFSHWYAVYVLNLDEAGEQRWKDGKAARKWEAEHSTPF